jgi:hypothetical protein
MLSSVYRAKKASYTAMMQFLIAQIIVIIYNNSSMNMGKIVKSILRDQASVLNFLFVNVLRFSNL